MTFADATTGTSYTIDTTTGTMTVTVPNVGSFTATMDSDNTIAYDDTDTSQAHYTATWNDKTGDGVTTDDTITVVTTALSDTTKMTATATVTLDATTYNLTSTYNATFHLPTMGHFSVTLSAHPQKCL